MTSTNTVVSSSISASPTRQRTEAAGVAGQGAAVQQALEAAVAPDAYGEAVIVTLSEAGQKQVVKNEGRAEGQTVEWESFDLKNIKNIDDRTNFPDIGEELGRKSEISMKELFLEKTKEYLNYIQEKVSFLETVEPEASKVLTGKEAEDTLRMLNSFRQGDVTMSVSESGRRAWGVGDKVYALYPDGTLTVGKAGVPESEGERQSLLDYARKQLADLGASITSATNRIAELRAGSSAQ